MSTGAVWVCMGARNHLLSHKKWHECHGFRKNTSEIPGCKGLICGQVGTSRDVLAGGGPTDNGIISEVLMNTQTAILNGLNLQQMGQTVTAISNDPALAQFQFRARNQWISGGENRSTIKDFRGAGVEDSSRGQPFEFTNGEPPVLLGHNEGANPEEFLLHALAGCVTTTTVLHAAARGIKLNRLSTYLVGDIDLQGLLGLDDTVPPGYRSIRIEMDI